MYRKPYWCGNLTVATVCSWLEFIIASATIEIIDPYAKKETAVFLKRRPPKKSYQPFFGPGFNFNAAVFAISHRSMR